MSKIIVSRSNLLDGLETVIPGIKDDKASPMLKTVLMKAKDNVMILCSNSISIMVFKAITLEEKSESLSLCVDCRFMYELIKKTDGDLITLVPGENNVCNIISGCNETVIPTFDALAFPSVDVKANEIKKVISVKGSVLTKGINSVIYAVTTDSSRPMLMNVNLSISNKETPDDNGNEVSELKFVGSDGYRAAFYTEEVRDMENGTVLNVNIPKDSAKVITSLVSKTECDVQVSSSQKYISFTYGTTSLYIQLFEGQFMDAKRFFPAEFNSALKVSRKDMLTGVEVVELLISTQQKGSPVIFDVSEDEMVISTTTEISNYTRNLKVQKEGENRKVKFNPIFISNALKCMDSEDIEIRLSPDLGAALFKDKNIINIISQVR